MGRAEKAKEQGEPIPMRQRRPPHVQGEIPEPSSPPAALYQDRSALLFEKDLALDQPRILGEEILERGGLCFKGAFQTGQRRKPFQSQDANRQEPAHGRLLIEGVVDAAQNQDGAA